MNEQLNLPEELKSNFRSLLRGMPVYMRNDKESLKTFAIYLKTGGMKLARQGIVVAKELHREELKLIREKRLEEALENQIRDARLTEENQNQATPEKTQPEKINPENINSENNESTETHPENIQNQ